MDCALCASHDLANEVLLEITPGVPRIQPAHAQSTYHLTVILVELRPYFVPELLVGLRHSTHRRACIHMFMIAILHTMLRRAAVVAASRGIAKPKPSTSSNTICRALDHLRMAQKLGTVCRHRRQHRCSKDSAVPTWLHRSSARSSTCPAD